MIFISNENPNYFSLQKLKKNQRNFIFDNCKQSKNLLQKCCCYFTLSVIFFRRPYPGTNHPEWLPTLEGPISIQNPKHIHIYTCTNICVNMSFETPISIRKSNKTVKQTLVEKCLWFSFFFFPNVNNREDP